MIHQTLLIFAIAIYVGSVLFLYLKDFLPVCNGLSMLSIQSSRNALYFQPSIRTMIISKLEDIPTNQEQEHSQEASNMLHQKP